MDSKQTGDALGEAVPTVLEADQHLHCSQAFLSNLLNGRSRGGALFRLRQSSHSGVPQFHDRLCRTSEFLGRFFATGCIFRHGA
jgi:hypothetical protein